jgi:transketolase
MSAVLSTRKAYGMALLELAKTEPNLVVLDAETGNSTFTENFAKAHPDKFIESFIAEQNMVGMALGLSRRGKIPFVSTFAAFFTRAFDQIRMSQYSNGNIKFVGSHSGVSIGEDGASQMALEDLAMMRSVQNMRVLYPSDGTSMMAMVSLTANTPGNFYIRATRADTPILYDPKEEFTVSGSKTIRSSQNDQITVFGAGITLHEALKAHDGLLNQGINLRVVDMYSIKPLDQEVIRKACQDTQALVVVEDHYREGGLYEAICGSGVVIKPVYSLSVDKMPRSGKPAELLRYQEIDAQAIQELVNRILKSN